MKNDWQKNKGAGFSTAMKKPTFFFAFFQIITHVLFTIVGVAKVGDLTNLNASSAVGGFFLIIYGACCGVFYFVTVLAMEMSVRATRR